MGWRCGGCCPGGGGGPDNLVNNYQSDSYELVDADINTNTCIVMDLAADGILTVPAIATLGDEPADGAIVYLHAIGDGLIVVQHELGDAFLSSPYNKTQLATAGARAMLVYLGDYTTDLWSLEGNLA